MSYFFSRSYSLFSPFLLLFSSVRTHTSNAQYVVISFPWGSFLSPISLIFSHFLISAHAVPGHSRCRCGSDSLPFSLATEDCASSRVRARTGDKQPPSPSPSSSYLQRKALDILASAAVPSRLEDLVDNVRGR